MINELKLSENEVKDAWQAVMRAENITLLTHTKPDADGISACAVLEFILLKSGKKYIETIYPDEQEFLHKKSPKNVKIGRHEQIPDVIIMCDTSIRDRTYFPNAFSKAVTINIDHHKTNTGFGNINLVNEKASSVCEMVFDFLKTTDFYVDRKIATCLLSGILSDTGALSNAGTTSEAINAVSDLVRCGARIDQVVDFIFRNRSINMLRLWGLVLSRLKVSKKLNVAHTYITDGDIKQHQLTRENLNGFANILNMIADVDFAVLLEKRNGETKVNLRTTNDSIDVAKVVKSFGGGGHQKAAGFTTDWDMERTKRELGLV